jgi:hypothetical protein
MSEQKAHFSFPATFTIPKKLMDEAGVRWTKAHEKREKEIDEYLKECKGKGIIMLRRLYVDENRELIRRIVDVGSLEIDGVDGRDAPDFSDAFFSAGQYEDGTKMSDEELNELADEHPDILQEKIYHHASD